MYVFYMVKSIEKGENMGKDGEITGRGEGDTRRNFSHHHTVILHRSNTRAPSDYHLFPGLKNTIERSPFFVRRGGHCCRGDLVGRTDNLLILFFLSGLQKLEQRAKKCIELRGEYVE